MKRKKTFSVEYNYFAPGTLVTCNQQGPLKEGVVYEVVACCEPTCAGDACICILDGQAYGVDARYLQEIPTQ